MKRATAQRDAGEHLDVLKDAPGRNLSRLMELGAESRDPQSEKLRWKHFIYWGKGGLWCMCPCVCITTN